MGRLAEALACDASNVTGLVDRLESRGLIQRRPSAEDRRVKVLSLTPAGARLRALVVERMTAPPATIGRLSQDEQRLLANILRRLLEHLAALDLREITIVLGYLGPSIRDAVAAWALPLDVRFVDNAEYATSNNGYSTLLAAPHAAGHEMLLLDADIVCEREVVRAVIEFPRADCLAMRRSKSLGVEEMKILLDENGRVRECAKTVDPKFAAGESIGLNRFSAGASTRLFAALDDRVRVRGLVHEWNDSAVQQMIDEQAYELWPVDVGDRYCAEIDTPADLAEVDRIVRARAW
jgi:choline kinase